MIFDRFFKRVGETHESLKSEQGIPIESLPRVSDEVAAKMKQVITDMNERDTLTLAKKIVATAESGQISMDPKQQAEIKKSFDNLLDAMNSKDHYRNQGHTLPDADLARLDLKTSDSYERRSTFVHTDLKLLLKEPNVLMMINWLHSQDKLIEPALTKIDQAIAQ